MSARLVDVPQIDPVGVATDRAIEEIEHELGMRFDVYQRLGVASALERFESVVRFHAGDDDPW